MVGQAGESREGASALVNCRVGCGACCIAPSISSPIPGMPSGKPGGVRCVQLTPNNRCRLFGQVDRPGVCGRLRPDPEMCGENYAEALTGLMEMEQQTDPGGIFHWREKTGK